MIRRAIKEPTNTTIFSASFLALFELINSSGYSDNVAIRAGLIDNTPVAGEKLVVPTTLSFDVWGELKIGTIDYAIVLFLAYTLAGMFLYRPGWDDDQKVQERIFAIRSIRWIRFGTISLIIALIFTANMGGYFADMWTNVTGETKEGYFWREGGSWGFQEFTWGIVEVLQLVSLYSIFLYSIWNGIEIDSSKLNPIPDNRNFIERIWGGVKQAERDQRTDIELGAVKANESFTKLVNLLGAASALNLAAASLDEGNVKGAFNKWKNLTHRKGKQHAHWTGLSESLDQAGSFAEEEE